MGFSGESRLRWTLHAGRHNPQILFLQQFLASGVGEAGGGLQQQTLLDEEIKELRDKLKVGRIAAALLRALAGHALLFGCRQYFFGPTAQQFT